MDCNTCSFLHAVFLFDTGNPVTHIKTSVHHHAVNGDHTSATSSAGDPVIPLNGRNGVTTDTITATSAAAKSNPDPSLRNGDSGTSVQQVQEDDIRSHKEDQGSRLLPEVTTATSTNSMEGSDPLTIISSASSVQTTAAASAIKDEKSVSSSTSSAGSAQSAVRASGDGAAAEAADTASKMTVKGRKAHAGAGVQSSSSSLTSRKGHHHQSHHQQQRQMGSRVPIHPVIPEMPLRLVVHSDMVGAIIGKSGNTIKEITKESKARIDVLRNEGSGPRHHVSTSSSSSSMDKVVNIFGATDHCVKACAKIIQVIRDEARSMERSHQDFPLRILAHNSLVGRVIGKSGINVKRIMDSTNTKIIVSHNVFDPLAYNLPERMITITGTDDIIPLVDAVHQIFSKLRTCYEGDMSSQLPAAAAVSYFGYPAAATTLSGSSPFHSRIPAAHGMGSGQSGSSARHGSISGQGYGSSFFAGSPFPPPGTPPYMTAYHHHHPAAAASSLPPFIHPGDHVRETAILYIPDTCVGGIIGSGGSTIREMMHASGATIKVTPLPKGQQKGDGKEKDRKLHSTSAPVQELEATVSPSDPSGEKTESESESQQPHHQQLHQTITERKVTVSGTPESQWKAQMMIFRKVLMDQNLPTASSASSSPHEPSLRVEISVPASQVGRIIGKNGQTVRELQRLTRALIKLPEPPGEGTPAPAADAVIPVSIMGDFFSSQNAQRQIRALVTRAQVSSLMSSTSSASHDYWSGVGMQRLSLRDHNIQQIRRGTGIHTGDVTSGGKGSKTSKNTTAATSSLTAVSSEQPTPGKEAKKEKESSEAVTKQDQHQ